MDEQFSDRLAKALASIARKIDFKPQLALVTGTGLAGLLGDIKVETIIAYKDIHGFPLSTAPSHKGELIFGEIAGKKIVAQNGRFHCYEGWSGDDIVLPVYVMAQLGARNYVVTNAAGALNEHYRVGEIMLIEDHLNFLGIHPLKGLNDDKLGPRFPDMSRAYNPELIVKTKTVARNLNLTIQNGIYVAVHGPEFETSAERRFLRFAGGDAVGMSTVPEVIAANHAGMQVLGFSAITNQATGGKDQQPDTLEEVLENADVAAADIRKIVLQLIRDGDL
jgi:purine-nucleoside phosphorylase